MVTGVHANLECIGAEFINLVIYNIVSSFKNSVSTCISLFGCHIYIYIYISSTSICLFGSQLVLGEFLNNIDIYVFGSLELELFTKYWFLEYLIKKLSTKLVVVLE